VIAALTNRLAGISIFDAGGHMRSSILLILGITLVVALTACGFQLRGYGQQTVALKSLALTFGADVSPGSWRSALNRQLKQAGITLSPEASTKLTITEIKVEKKIVSYDNRGKAAEYELAQSVSLRISSQPTSQSSMANEPTPPSTASVTPFSDTLRRARVYTFDPENISGKNQEERLLAREIQAELIRDIMLRLSDFSQHTQASQTDATNVAEAADNRASNTTPKQAPNQTPNDASDTVSNKASTEILTSSTDTQTE
jgi:LPS-assembly lipoprotein